ncbi:MAG: FHA domain-containing protein [Myxococcales bacterium]|nr:FHA domain-containing protein [Myxococcales bacterium]
MTDFFLPFAEFVIPDGSLARVTAGGLIGRASTADLQIDDPTVSELHAMVSLRGRGLKLLSLRRDVLIGGRPQKTVALEPGLRVRLSSRVLLQVADVVLPPSVLVLIGVDREPVELSASVTSLVRGSEPGTLALSARYKPDALAHIWSNADGLKIKIGDHPPESIRAGMSWSIGDRPVRVEERAVLRGVQTTQHQSTVSDESLCIVGRFETVHIYSRGQAKPVVISGRAANLISLLISFKAPVRWEMLAREIWGDEKSAVQLQELYYVTLRRLRLKLRVEGVRPDLVRPDGRGNVELNIYTGDELVDDS